MAHLTHTLPKSFALVNGAETVTADIFAVQVLVAADASLTVKAAGIFEQVTANNGNGTHIGSDGVNLGSTHDAGFYERRSDVNTTLPCIAGNVIYGDFKAVTGTSGDQIICYLK
tara:strand:+ start:5521 stop:5862 length:342 start_codon:yes stop_codon:yes gene_type:complete